MQDRDEIARWEAAESRTRRSRKVAHDVRNICATIRVAIELMNERDRLDEASMEVLHAATMRSVIRLEQLMSIEVERAASLELTAAAP